MARISLTPRRTLTLRVARWYGRRKFGQEVDPLLAVAHNPRILRTVARLEMSVQGWKTLDESLKHLAVMVSAARIGCTWCMDFGHWEADKLGLPMEKISKVPAWRDT